MARVYPVPELVFDDFIDVKDTGSATEGCMDNRERLMRVPLLDTPACRHVRAHEMAHAKYSPKAPYAPKGVSQMIVQRVEDMRMNGLCRRQGLDEAMDARIIPSREFWGKLLSNPEATLTAGVSTFGTGDWRDWVRESKASTDDIEFIESLWDELNNDPTWKNTRKMSVRVHNYLNPDDPLPEPEDGEGDGEGEGGEGGRGPGDKRMSGLGDSGGIDSMVDAMLEDEAAEEAKTPFEKGLDLLEHHCELNGKHGYYSGDAYNVEPKIVTRPLTQRLKPSKFKSRAKVPADRGMVPKHMNRYCSDKAIFAGRGKKRDHGGTILIDCSGSMHISSGDIDRIMDIAPLGTIATYCGSGERGEIWILAKNGKRVAPGSDMHARLGGNLIDQPAVEWMVKQPGPYYWVCDGGVSGAKKGSLEHFAENIYRACIELVKKHGIIMVPKLDQLPEIMRQTI